MPEVSHSFPLRKRDDLVADRLTSPRGAVWVVKDPLALEYHHFHDEEYAVLESLDGRRTLAEVRELFERRFAPRTVRAEEIASFASRLHEKCLVVSEAPDLGDQNRKRRELRRTTERRRRLLRFYALRFRGVDPQAFLDRCYPFVRPLLSPAATCLALAVMFAAVLLIAVHWHEFLARMPSHQQFFTPTTLPALSASLAVLKVCHELGHAFVCRHFGGRCHELGLMILIFTPCLYCNVTDAWRFPTKWRRIAVSAAGIYVELAFAALATFGWWYSTPGLFHHLCLSVMFICSVNTLIFNGNPLLRYDGYYIVADLFNAPNLASTSSAVFWRYAERLVCEPRDVDDPFLPRRHRFWYAAYYLVSSSYRLVLLFSIAMFFIELARPYRLENIARGAALGALGMMLFQPLRQLVAWSGRYDTRLRARTWRVVASGAAASLLLGLIGFLPLPQRVTGALEIVPQDGRRVYVEYDGRLTEQTVRSGATVRSGEVLARLTNDALDLEIANLAAICAETKAALANLERERHLTPDAALRRPELNRRLEVNEKLLAEKQSLRARLTLTAQRDGTMLPAPAQASPTAAGELRTYQGCPDDPVNLGCTLPAGAVYCQIGDPHRWEAMISIEQADLPRVSLGQEVEMVFLQVPDSIFRGKVAEISQEIGTSVPLQNSNKTGGDIATQTDAAGQEKPLEQLYQVRVLIEDPEGLLRVGLRGNGKIDVADESIATRVGRWLRRTFHTSF